MTTISKSSTSTDEQNPFLDDDDYLTEREAVPGAMAASPLFVDMSTHLGTTGDVIRVELRKCRHPAAGKIRPERGIPEESYLIGLIPPEAVPQEGEEFALRYYNYNGQLDYGLVVTSSPAKNVLQVDNCFYFATSEGDWRLKLLGPGD